MVPSVELPSWVPLLTVPSVRLSVALPAVSPVVLPVAAVALLSVLSVELSSWVVPLLSRVLLKAL